VHDATLIHLNALPQGKINATYATQLTLFLERSSRAIEHISRLANRFCSCVPVFLFNRVADKRVHGGLEAVVGVGREDDVFELCAVGELLLYVSSC
jgi:hypothetical protein